jgi:hypothetical protein
MRNTLAFTVLAALAACGDDDDATDAGPADTGTADAGRDAGTDGGGERVDAGPPIDGGPVTCDLAPTADGTGRQDLVLAEIAPGAHVELYNGTDAPIDLGASDYWLCSPFDYQPLMMVGAGVTVPAHGRATIPWAALGGFTDTAAGGEVILYSSNAFDSPGAIEDFVCWGENPHGTRKATAEMAGKWTGACAGALSMGAILRHGGTAGTSASDYDVGAAPSPTTCAGDAVDAGMDDAGGTMDDAGGDDASSPGDASGDFDATTPGDAGEPDAGSEPDGGMEMDAGEPDAGMPDAGPPPLPMCTATLTVTSDGGGGSGFGAPQDLVISEINPGDYIELYNNTDTDFVIDASTPHLFCSPFRYVSLSTLAPGTVIPARGFAQLPFPAAYATGPAADTDAGGEIILYARGPFISPNIIDFVCWGVNPHGTRKTEAEAVDKWIASTPCAPAITGGAIHRVTGTAGNLAAHYDTTSAPSPMTCRP